MPFDYFNVTNETQTFVMPDGVSKVMFKKLSEGDRIAITKREGGIEYHREKGTIKMDVDVETQKLEALKRAIIGWELWSNDNPVPFDRIKVEEFITRLMPDVIDLMYEFLCEENKWLKGNQDSDNLKKQLENLQKNIKEAEDREKK